MRGGNKMTVRQISVFIENKPGTMVKITDALGNGGIDIRAASLADTQDFGILRLIVDDADKARNILSEIGCVTSVTDVIAAEVSDEPGAMTTLLNQLIQAQTIHSILKIGILIEIITTQLLKIAFGIIQTFKTNTFQCFQKVLVQSMLK